MRARYADLVICIGWAEAAWLMVLLGLQTTFLGVLLGLPLVLLLPGYALSQALLPSRGLGVPERGLLSLGMSLAVAALGGYLLDKTPWGLAATTWAALLGLITIVTAVAAILRRRALGAGQPDRLRWRPDWRLAALALLAGAVAFGALQVALAGAKSSDNQTSFTQLWMIPVDPSNPRQVEIGIRSMEEGPTTYKLQLSLGEKVAQEWTSISLNRNETWQVDVLLPASFSGRAQATLLLSNSPNTVYRQVFMQEASASK